ncbi:MAG: 2-C-methyl-D-erythritol 2,4-cyclodiphosphate synthase [Deltaproteobacteria bacterium]
MQAEAPNAGVIITAGGRGLRFGGLKQFEPLEGRPLFAHAALAASSLGGPLVVVVPPGEEARAREALSGLGLEVTVVPGGESRALSVRAGLEALPNDLRVVVVHDGVRPWASPGLFGRVARAADERGAAVPGLSLSETVKRVDGEVVLETLDRAALRSIQTPQAFRAVWLRAAFERAGPDAARYTDEAGMLEALGFPVAVIEGEAKNVKVTQPADLPRAKGRAPAAPRIGLGYDVHRFAAGRRLVLGGVEFPGDGLLGHSDADAVAHAVTDAVLGAAGLGDIGRHFPDTDPAHAGADSLELLARAVQLAAELGLAVQNVDLTIAARRPKIAPRAEELCAKLARPLRVSPAQVNVKATTGEGLGFVGREEGISVQAVALLWPT